MYEPHHSFKTPPAETELWRYMDLTKLLSLLTSRTLYFCQADLLGDPWEGALSEANLSMGRDLSTDFPGLLNTEQERSQRQRETRKQVYISCWHNNSVESAAMWKLYLKSDEGIAIKSSVGSLMKALAGCQEHVHIGPVEYIDYNSIVSNSWMQTFLYKRKSFEHEREIRAVIAPLGKMPLPGLRVPIIVEELISEIVLAPETPDWVLAAVQSTIEKFCLPIPARNSDLSKPPVF